MVTRLKHPLHIPGTAEEGVCVRRVRLQETPNLLRTLYSFKPRNVTNGLPTVTRPPAQLCFLIGPPGRPYPLVLSPLRDVTVAQQVIEATTHIMVCLLAFMDCLCVPCSTLSISLIVPTVTTQPDSTYIPLVQTGTKAGEIKTLPGIMCHQ